MTDESHSAHAERLPARIATLAQSLDAYVEASQSAPLAPETAEQLKQHIIRLYKEADEAVTSALRDKEAAKALADRWKQLRLTSTPTAARSAMPSAMPSAPPGEAQDAPTTAPTAPMRVDHLGASTFIEKGWNLLSLGKTAESVTALEKALALAPGQGDALTLLAWALTADGQLDAAAAPLAQARALNAADPLLCMVRGRWLALRGEFAEADASLAPVLEAPDGRAALYAHLYRALLQRELGAHDAAAVTLRRALQRGPNLVQAWYELGRTHWECGRRADAMHAWKSGSEANKFSPWGKHCAALLAAIEAGQEPSFVNA